jgi:hypothetical protein
MCQLNRGCIVKSWQLKVILARLPFFERCFPRADSNSIRWIAMLPNYHSTKQPPILIQSQALLMLLDNCTIIPYLEVVICSIASISISIIIERGSYNFSWKRPFAVPSCWLQMELKSHDFWQGARKTSWPYCSIFGFLIKALDFL